MALKVLVSDTGAAADYVDTIAETNVLNLGTDLAAKASVAQVNTRKLLYQFTYDFAVLGGVVGPIPLTQVNGQLPINFVIQNAFVDVLTALAGGAGATGALTSGQGAGDLVVATVVAGVPWSTLGQKVTIPLLGTVGTWIKTTAARSPALVVAINALTQGKFNLFVEGVVSA